MTERMEWGVKNEARRGELRAVSEMEGPEAPGVGIVRNIESERMKQREREKRGRERKAELGKKGKLLVPAQRGKASQRKELKRKEKERK